MASITERKARKEHTCGPDPHGCGETIEKGEAYFVIEDAGRANGEFWSMRAKQCGSCRWEAEFHEDVRRNPRLYGLDHF